MPAYPPDLPQKHSHKPFFIVIGIAVMLLVFVVVLLIRSTMNRDETTQPIETPSPTDSTEESDVTPLPTTAPSTVELQTFIEQGSYRIDYPVAWRLDATVFYNGEQKVAEFAPGTYTPITPITCGQIHQNQIEGADSLETEEGIGISFELPLGQEPVLRNESLTIANRNWQLLSYEITPEGAANLAPWYPHQYCTQENGKVFAITFYERNKDNFDIALHSQILSTLEFLE